MLQLLFIHVQIHTAQTIYNALKAFIADGYEIVDIHIQVGVQHDTTGDIYSSSDVTGWGLCDVKEDGTVTTDRVVRYKTGAAAVAALKAGKVVILACGLGSPYFSTDTAAVLRAAEIEADAVLMAKNIDGVYSADPKIDPTAKRYDEITYAEVVQKKLKALDLTATTFCMDNDIKTYAFELNDPMNIYRVVMGEKIGTELHC